MEWSTPSRMAGEKPLTPLPVEVYLEIFGYVIHSVHWTRKQRRRALANLAFVCRFFHAVAIPQLFRSLHVTGNTSDSETAGPVSASLVRSILQKKEPGISLACHIEDCSFENWEESWGIPGFLKMYGRALGQLPNLQSLTLKRIDIHHDFLKSICGLKALKRLSIDEVTFHFNREDLLQMSSLALTEFSFTKTSVDFADFAHRIVNPIQLESLITDHWDVAEGILTEIPSNTLKKLILETVHSVPIILAKSMSLEILEMTAISSDGQSTLPASTPPKLRRLVCRPNMLTLVPGSSISSIGVKMPYNITAAALDGMAMECISLLKQSSATLTDISIPLRLYLSVPFFEAFPDVENLHIDLLQYPFDRSMPSDPNFDEVVRTVMCNLPPNSARSLVSLGFKRHVRYTSAMPMMDTRLQHELLLLLEAAFPNLLDVRFVSGVQWSRATNRNNWIGDVPYEDFSYIHYLYQRDGLDELKFGGVFQRFCDRGGLE